MKILLVEDSVRLQRAIKEGFVNEGYAVDIAADGMTGFSMLETNEYDLVILDLMLPLMDGLTLLSRIRAQGKKVHVIILSAKDQVEDRVRGLEKGADDYLVKPFVFHELVARVRALLRRKYDRKDPLINVGALQINTANHTVYKGTDAVELTPKEYALLECLLLQRGHIVSRDQLTAYLYEGYGDIASNVIDVVICTLRKKIQIPGAPPVILTKRGAGYLID